MKKIAIIFLPIIIVVLLSVVFAKDYLFPQKRTLDFGGEKIITIDDEGLNYKLTTTAVTVGELAGIINPNLSEEDEVIPARNIQVLPGMLITINRQARIIIDADGEKREITTLSKTVVDALAESKVFLAPVDEIEPGLDTKIGDGQEIRVTRKNTEVVTIEEPIEFSVVKQKDNLVDWGEKTISQEGEEGIREITYRIDYENGKETKRVKLASKITKKPVTQIEKTGTRLKVGKADTGIASWYNAGLYECAHRTFPRGTWLRVTNSANGKQVYVKVAGYGPQAGTGKLIDLDNKAFKEIAPLGQGVVKVKVEEILSKGFKLEL